MRAANLVILGPLIFRTLGIEFLLRGSLPRMNTKIEKGLIGAAVLAGLILMLPIAKQSKEFMNCVKNAETGIINLSGVSFTDLDGKGGFIERPIAVHYCNGGDVAKYLRLVGQ